MNKFFLYLVMLPSGLWRSLGADTDQLRAILDVRLKIDDRKPAPFGRQRAQKKEKKNGSWLNMFMSLALGLLYMFPLALEGERIFSLTIFFSLVLIMLTFTLITDFSTVLFDTRDQFIIFPRPVNDPTIVLSRLLHVFIYLLRIVLPMCLPSCVFLGLVDGWQSALLFPLPVLLMVFMALFVVNGIYLLLLTLSRPEKFKEIINYFQIVFSVLFFTSAYILPRAINGLRSLDLRNYPWMVYLPSYWLASCWSWIGVASPLPGTKLISLLAILFPLICLWLLIRYLAPQFMKKIAGISSDDRPMTTNGKAHSGWLYKSLASLVNRTGAAKAGFIITWLQTGRSRSFKMKIYPTFATTPLYFVYIMFFVKKASLSESWHNLPNGNGYFGLLYMSSFVLLQAMIYLCISDQYKAAWVYYAAPLQTPGQVMSGAFKALWIKYILPFFTLISIFIIYVWGPGKIPDLILGLVNVTLFAMILMRMSFRYFPFSKKDQMNQAGNRVLKTFIAMGVGSLFGVGHYIAKDMLLLKIIFIILSGLFLLVVWDSFAKTNWEHVYKEDSEL